jgi:DNA invertase Pin-like site-specific DNA recombinase
MQIGYARVSTYDQTLNLQRDALTQAGCTRIFTDTASGVKAERKGLEEALSYIRAGDTLVVWRLDRLGRSLRACLVKVRVRMVLYTFSYEKAVFDRPLRH